MAVRDELTRLRARIGEAQAIHQIVQAHLQDLQQILTRLAGARGGIVEMPVELALQHPICPTHTLLLAQLLRVAGFFTSPTGPMLTGASITALKCALGDALVAFQEQFYPLTPAQLADGSGITRHVFRTSL